MKMDKGTAISRQHPAYRTSSEANFKLHNGDEFSLSDNAAQTFAPKAKTRTR
jgi:hypothetical protein